MEDRTSLTKSEDDYRQLSRIKHKIKGSDNQFLQILLEAGQQIICKRVNILYFEEGIEIKSSMNNTIESKKSGLMSKIVDASKAVIKGEKVFVYTLVNNSNSAKKIGFSGIVPGKIMALNVNSPNREFFINPDSLLCASSNVHIGVSNNSESGSTAFITGETLTKVEGKGVVFINSEGNAEKHELEGKGSILAEPSTVLARSSSVNLTIKKINHSGNTYANRLLSGNGIVFIQTNPSKKFIKKVTSSVLNILKQLEKKNKG